MSGQEFDLTAWLRGLGLERYAQAFQDAEVTPEILPELTDAELRELGVPLGPRKVMLNAVRRLAKAAPITDSVVEVDRAETELDLPPSKAERRQVTIMFVDMVGSTAMASRLDPEDMREILRAFQNSVTGEILRAGGHVTRLMGDGVLAFFGWPRADEEDAERAVESGLTIVESIGQLAIISGERLSARLRIATGLVVVGDLIGTGAAREDELMGATPNLAARLQEVAAPGGVVIAEATRQLLGGMFELRDLGPLQLKGFDHTVGGHRVLGRRHAESRFDARRSCKPTQMIGRDRELALMLDLWRQATSGDGQALLLVGEPGIGKSRLVRATIDALSGREHAIIRYQCSPHHTDTPLWPVISSSVRLPASARMMRIPPSSTSSRHCYDAWETLPMLRRCLQRCSGSKRHAFRPRR